MSAPSDRSTGTSFPNDERLLKLLFTHLPFYVFWKDDRFVYRGCNRLFAIAAGLSRSEDIVGLTNADLPWPSRDADFYRYCEDRIIEYDRAETNIIETMRRADGVRVWLRTSKIPLHDASGHVCGLLGISEDISELIGLQERLRHYEVMASTVDDMMAIISPEYRYLAVNDAYCAAYAASRDHLIGNYVVELIGEELFDMTMQPLLERALSGTITRFECWRSFPGSGQRHTEYTFYPVFNDIENVIGLIAKIHDNTKAKRLESQLHQSQKLEAIGRLAGGIAHDFNNILSIINGYSDLCLLDMASDAPCRNKIEQINEAGNRAAALTQQLLGFSRKQIIQPQVLDLGREITVLKKMLERIIGERIALTITVDESLWFVKMDRSQFEQIVMNLVVNGRDAINGPGSIAVTLSNHRVETEYQSSDYLVASGDYVSLVCADTGSGMTAEIQARMFEPFFTTKAKGAGTGFGLSTVYGIVKQNGGYISVKSEVNAGATFSLLLPRANGSETVVPIFSEPPQENLPRGSETVLLVEDDHALREMCITILRDLGYTAIGASNGREAVETAASFPGDIDLMVTDVMMPEMNGAEAAERIVRDRPNVAVLYMSGYTEAVIVDHGVLDSGVHFLQKPVTPKRLAQAVRSCLATRLN